MTVTKILGEQSGLQYQGVQDKSEADPRDNLINVLFTGEFKNGPFNKPFKVTQANMRAKLGFDPDSLQYQAIQDALNTGVPFVWVMRVQGAANLICASLQTQNASNYIQLNTMDDFEKFMNSMQIKFTTHDGRTYKANPDDMVIHGGSSPGRLEIEWRGMLDYREMQVCAAAPFEFYLPR